MRWRGDLDIRSAKISTGEQPSLEHLSIIPSVSAAGKVVGTFFVGDASEGIANGGDEFGNLACADAAEPRFDL